MKKVKYTFKSILLIVSCLTVLNVQATAYNCITLNEWDSTITYDSGAEVQSQGGAYKAKSRVKRKDPVINKGRKWLSLGACDTDKPVIGGGLTNVAYKYANNFGMISEIDGPRTDVIDITKFTYQTATGNLETVTNALNQTVTYQDYNTDGLPQTIIDINGNSTLLIYTTEGWLAASTKGGLTTTYRYDGNGLVRFVTTPGDNAVEFIYNDARLLRFIKYANGVQKEMQYDLMGNVTSMLLTAPDKATVVSNYDYDELERLTDVLYSNSKTSHKYDKNNNPETDINGFNASSTKQYDNLNRLTKYIDEVNGVVDYTYNAHNHVTSVTDDNGAQTLYSYDVFGRLEQLTSPDTGITTYKYDDAGNQTLITDARGKSIVQRFDELNRLTDKQFSGAPHESVTFTYDTAINGVGKLASIENAKVRIAYEYDALERMTKQTNILQSDIVGEVIGTTEYGYDATLRLLNSIIYPSGAVVNYETNAVGEIIGINLSGTGITTQRLASLIAYNVVGNIESLTYGNGVNLTRTFGADGQAVSQSATGIWDLTYGYDQNRNLSDIINTLNTTENKTFTYYFNNRLQTATHSVDTTSFTYDGVGNRLTQSNLTFKDTYQYVLQSNKLDDVNANLFTYDEMGNTLTSELHNQTYSYNAEGRLSEVTDTNLQATYHYNGLSERVIKQIGNDIYLYFYNTAGQLLETQHYQGVNKVSSKQIIWLGAMPVAQVETDAQAQVRIVYIHVDHLNTPRKATDDKGLLIWLWQSDAFGSGLPNEDVDLDQQLTTIDLRFPGQIYDAESGLYYNYYRYYDPQLGRYITSDPIGLNGGINTFAYVGGNPVGVVDLKGLCFGACTTAAIITTTAYFRSHAPAAIASLSGTIIASRLGGKDTWTDTVYKSAYAGGLALLTGRINAPLPLVAGVSNATGQFLHSGKVDLVEAGVAGTFAIPSALMTKGAGIFGSPMAASLAGEYVAQSSGYLFTGMMNEILNGVEYIDTGSSCELP